MTLLILVCISFIFGCADKSEKVPAPQISQAVTQSPYSEPLVRTEEQLIKMTAKVKAIDFDNRMVTFLRSDGRTEKMKVDPSVKRLHEVKVGDFVSVEYYSSLAIEVREPTKLEKSVPKVVTGVAGKAGPEESPAAGLAGSIHAIVTVENVNVATQQVTVKGPEGRFITVKAKDPKNLDRIKKGDTIAITYTEALAIGIVPVAEKQG